MQTVKIVVTGPFSAGKTAFPLPAPLLQPGVSPGLRYGLLRTFQDLHQSGVKRFRRRKFGADTKGTRS